MPDAQGLQEHNRYTYMRDGVTLVAEKVNDSWRAFDLRNRSAYFEAKQRIEAMRALHAYLDAKEDG